MTGIRRNQAALHEAHERSKTVTRSDEMKGIREKMQDDIDEISKTAHQVKARLERLDKMNEQALSRPVRPLLTEALQRRSRDLRNPVSLGA